jgi:MFS family permease
MSGLQEDSMFHGWYVVGGVFLIAVWGWGLGFYGLGIYLVALGREHGWSISAVSVAITAYYLMGAVVTASVGDLMRRLGVSRTVAGGVIAMAAGVASLASITELWQLYAALAAMAVGWACMSGAAINIILAPWFERKRGVAVSRSSAWPSRLAPRSSTCTPSAPTTSRSSRSASAWPTRPATSSSASSARPPGRRRPSTASSWTRT